MPECLMSQANAAKMNHKMTRYLVTFQEPFFQRRMSFVLMQCIISTNLNLNNRVTDMYPVEYITIILSTLCGFRIFC